MHTPVLLNEVIRVLNPKPGDFFIDGTVNEGGHAKEIIKRLEPGGIFLGMDWDKDALEKAKNHLHQGRLSGFHLVNDNYAMVPEVMKNLNLPKSDCLLLDLGLSSDQLESSGRGFSFQKNEPLDMRYSLAAKLTAADILNHKSKNELVRIFREYGEEKKAETIASLIISTRRKKSFETTNDLMAIVSKVAKRQGRLNPATKIFQSLRIAVNFELDNLNNFLALLPKIMNKKGRVAIISFHSLEDRLVKNYFRVLIKNHKAEAITKKPTTPSYTEIKTNPRSRSAKLRAIQLLNI